MNLAQILRPWRLTDLIVFLFGTEHEIKAVIKERGGVRISKVVGHIAREHTDVFRLILQFDELGGLLFLACLGEQELVNLLKFHQKALLLSITISFI